jgi:hypothetical protein
LIRRLSVGQDLPRKQAQIKPQHTKEEQRPFYTIYLIRLRALSIILAQYLASLCHALSAHTISSQFGPLAADDDKGLCLRRPPFGTRMLKQSI